MRLLSNDMMALETSEFNRTKTVMFYKSYDQVIISDLLE